MIRKGQTHIFDYRGQRGSQGQAVGSIDKSSQTPDGVGSETWTGKGAGTATGAGTGSDTVTDTGIGTGERTWEVGENTILVDTREFSSPVVKHLSRLGFTIRSEQIDVGDYILSDRIGIERKEVGDFISSLKDGRLFRQLGMLVHSFTRPVVIIEGEGLLSPGGLSPASIFGVLASIVTDYGIPVIQTGNHRETAAMISAISRREYAEARPAAVRVDIGAGSLQDRQHFIIEGLPNVSAVLARRLLDHFGSVRAVLGASEEELMEVKGVGRKTAAEIVKVLDVGYLRKDDAPVGTDGSRS